MTSSAVWHCKCGKHGVDGPDGWKRHYSLAHSDMGGAGVHLSFGFTPNYSNGMRTSKWYDGYFPTPRASDAEFGDRT